MFLWHLKTEERSDLQDQVKIPSELSSVKNMGSFFFLPNIELVYPFLFLCELWKLFCDIKISRFFGILKLRKEAISKAKLKYHLNYHLQRTWAPFFFLPDIEPVYAFLFLCELWKLFYHTKILCFFGILILKKEAIFKIK